MAKAGVPRKRHKLIHGHGINDAPFCVSVGAYTDEHGIRHPQWQYPLYTTWHGMIQRVFDPKLHNKHPTYLDVNLYEPWKRFTLFHEWALKEDYQGKTLDKDILGDGKLYSPDTCCFVNVRVNNFLVGNKLKNSTPLGTYFRKESGKYRAQVEVLGKCYSLGNYSNMHEAHLVYCKKKLELADSLISEENLDERVATALIQKLQKKVDEAESLYQQSLI